MMAMKSAICILAVAYTVNALNSIGWGIYPEDKYRSKPSKKASIWNYFNELISGLFSKSQVE